MPRIITDNPAPNDEPLKGLAAHIMERAAKLQAATATDAPEPVCDIVPAPNGVGVA